MKVKFSEYKKEVHEFKVLLNMVGIAVDYVTCDLILKAMKGAKVKGTNFDIGDAVKLQEQHKVYWEKYAEDNPEYVEIEKV